MKKYLLLGSCRVVNTVAHETKDNIINNNDLWFTHYPQEHIQKIKHIFGIEKISNNEDVALFIRKEQKSHYKNRQDLDVCKSVETGCLCINNKDNSGVLNVVTEIASIGYIRVPYKGKTMWGHTTNRVLIRASDFQQVEGKLSDEELLKQIDEFERIVVESVIEHKIASEVNFIYVPHSPFINVEGEGWIISEIRQRVYSLLFNAFISKGATLNLPITRTILDVKTMIENNGGIGRMLQDQNHYSPRGRKVAYKYIKELSR